MQKVSGFFSALAVWEFDRNIHPSRSVLWGSGRLVATVRQGEQFLLRFLGRYQLLARHAGKETVEEELFLSSSDGYRPLFSGSGLTSRSFLVFSLEQEVGVPS